MLKISFRRFTPQFTYFAIALIVTASTGAHAAKAADAVATKKSGPSWVVEFPVLPKDAKNHSVNAPDACDPGEKGLILKYRKKNRFWICVTEESGMETTDPVPKPGAKKPAPKKVATHKDGGKKPVVVRHFHVDQGFKVYFKTDDGHIENMITEGEVSNNPLNITVSDNTVTLTSLFKILSPKQKLSLRPFRDIHIVCEDKNCNALPPTCAFHLKESDDRAAVQAFDSAARNFNQELKKKKDALKTKAFTYLDNMFLLAVSGQKNARKRFEFFPLAADGAAAEKIAGYQDALKLTAQLGCETIPKPKKK